ncbi:hypothetical protein H5410_045939 [Solanum commersonii]|uniref:Uncharacterized protein n=1 Tax=Solanum commersonii TaxID=4109 RepID=A0A9J5XAX3_SOLCO|nr:hypothetical protein H5410_045939 [Solanum commersonii]
MNEFPSLCEIASNQDSSISHNWKDKQSHMHLFGILGKIWVGVGWGGPDSLKWKDGDYTVKARYSHLCSLMRSLIDDHVASVDPRVFWKQPLYLQEVGVRLSSPQRLYASAGWPPAYLV